jgi:hypothetical protein
MDSSDRADNRQENLGGKPPTREVKALWNVWLAEMQTCYPGLTIVRWGGDDRGKIGVLIKDCGSSAVVENALRYVVRNWKTLGKRYFKGNMNAVPSVGFLVKMRATLVPESEIWSKHAATLAEFEQAQKQFTDPFSFPEDLRNRVKQAREELAGIGLG